MSFPARGYRKRRHARRITERALTAKSIGFENGRPERDAPCTRIGKVLYLSCISWAFGGAV